MPVQSNTSRVVHDFQNKTSRIVRDFENIIVETVEAFVKEEKKRHFDDFFSRAKEAGFILHPSQEYKEAFEEYVDKMLQNTPQQIEKSSKKMKEFFELLGNDEEAAHSFYEKGFQNLGIPIPGEKDGVCTDLQLIEQFVDNYF